MLKLVLVLASACAGHGRRAQPASQGLQSEYSAFQTSSQEALAALLTNSNPAAAFNPGIGSLQGVRYAVSTRPALAARKHTSMQAVAYIDEPAKRDAHYGSPLNVAQYLVDLHDAKATFDFCGGMMFQLQLSEKLRGHLAQVAKGDGEQPIVFDASKDRMLKIPDYSKSADSDNIRMFHGREIRRVPDAAGGMGFVLQLSFPEDDPEGWTQAEVAGYDGWGHDSGRVWRDGARLEREGFDTFRSKFGEKAFTLNHRFYLHFDRSNQLWLSAEDGCEGKPAQAANGLAKLLSALKR